MSDSETRTLIMKPPDRTCEQGILFRLSLMTTISDALMLACARTAGNSVQHECLAALHIQIKQPTVPVSPPTAQKDKRLQFTWQSLRAHLDGP